MSYLGSVPVMQYVVTAAADPDDIPRSSADPLEVEDALPEDVVSIQIVSNVASPFYLYFGPNANLEKILVVPGYASTVINLERQPVALSKGARLSVGAVANTDITAGTFVINCWV